MMVPKASWNYSLATETDRLIFACHMLYNRFYIKYGWLVLPYRIDGNPAVVYIPNLNFKKIPGFIEKVTKLKFNSFPVTKDQFFLKPISQALVKFGAQPEEDKIKKLKKEWQKKEKKFWEIVFSLFPGLEKKKIMVEIRPTSFGTLSSFSEEKLQNKKLNPVLYIRVDQPAGQIAEAILSSIFTQHLMEKEGFSWEEKEGVADFLIQHTPLKNLFPDYHPTLGAIRKKENAKLVQESRKYQQKLGVPLGKIFTKKNGEILINGQDRFGRLTEKERRLLHLLVENKNRFCSLDEIGKAVWEDSYYEVFSPWAIAKLVQRLREKFRRNGLSSALIQTQRGQGYLLRD